MVGIKRQGKTQCLGRTTDAGLPEEPVRLLRLHAAPVLRELDHGARLAPRLVRRPDLARLFDDPGRAGLFRPAAPRPAIPVDVLDVRRLHHHVRLHPLHGGGRVLLAGVPAHGGDQADHGRDVVGDHRRAGPGGSPGAGLAESGGTPDGDRRRTSGRRRPWRGRPACSTSPTIRSWSATWTVRSPSGTTGRRCATAGRGRRPSGGAPTPS